MRTITLAIAGLLLFSGCSSDPKPIEPRSNPTGSNRAPSAPEQALEDSPEGAAAFVKYYIDVFNYAARTGDVRDLKALSARDCAGCKRYIDFYERIYAAGGFFRDNDWKMSDVELEPGPERTKVFIRVTSPAGTTRADADERVHPGTAVDGDLIIEVDTDGDDRQVHRIERLAS